MTEVASQNAFVKSEINSGTIPLNGNGHSGKNEDASKKGKKWLLKFVAFIDVVASFHGIFSLRQFFTCLFSFGTGHFFNFYNFFFILRARGVIYDKEGSRF